MKYLKNILFYLAPLMLTAMMAFECGKELDPPVGPDNGDDTEIPATPGSGETTDPGENPGENPTPEPTPVEAYYVKVNQSYDDWSGDYLITYTSGSEVIVLNGFGDTKGSGKDISSSLTSEGIHSSTGDQYKAVVAKAGSGYTINVANVGYIGYEGSSNSLSAKTGSVSGDNKYQWSISYKSGIWVSNLGNSGRRLQWNASANCFRCYTGSQKELTLYRRTTSTGGSTPSVPTPDPEQPNPENPTPEDPDQPGQGGSGQDPQPPVTPPTPDPNDNCPNDWYELPTINYTKENGYYTSQSSVYGKVYYAHHICAGPETYKHDGAFKGKPMRNYTVCFSAEHHCPVWVAAPRHRCYESGASRTDAYAKDPKIPSDIQYKKKDANSGCNNGHMLGSAERLSSTATNKQVFYFSNIAPQYQDTFNTGEGGWNNLEDWVDGHVCSDTLYVVIGAYFKKFTDGRGYTAEPKTISFGGRSDVGCPTMFYYVLLRTKNGSSNKPLSQCTADELKCAAFVRSHKTPKYIKPSAAEMMSISDLEKVTGFTYFPNVPQLNKSACNPSDWGL